jgi:hypothetical protein
MSTEFQKINRSSVNQTEVNNADVTTEDFMSNPFYIRSYNAREKNGPPAEHNQTICHNVGTSPVQFQVI